MFRIENTQVGSTTLIEHQPHLSIVSGQYPFPSSQTKLIHFRDVVVLGTDIFHLTIKGYYNYYYYYLLDVAFGTFVQKQRGEERLVNLDIE